MTDDRIKQIREDYGDADWFGAGPDIRELLDALEDERARLAACQSDNAHLRRCLGAFADEEQLIDLRIRVMGLEMAVAALLSEREESEMPQQKPQTAAAESRDKP